MGGCDGFVRGFFAFISALAFLFNQNTLLYSSIQNFHAEIFLYTMNLCISKLSFIKPGLELLCLASDLGISRQKVPSVCEIWRLAPATKLII